jgi:hypothetical protein
VLRANPTVRQIQTMLAHIERALTARGATVQRETPGELTFRMPPPWAFAPVGWLAVITRGTATLSAWGGGPWRVSYRLHFGALQAVTGLVTLAIVVLGWNSPRLSLLGTILMLWVGGYAALHLVASHHFRRLLRDTMADVVERRTRPRAESAASTPATSQQPE